MQGFVPSHLLKVRIFGARNWRITEPVLKVLGYYKLTSIHRMLLVNAPRIDSIIWAFSLFFV